MGKKPPSRRRLVLVSNRVPSAPMVAGQGPDREGAVGGLVNAIQPVMERQGGLWFGWSGKSTARKPDTIPTVSSSGRVALATLDLSEDEAALYYTGFANRTLWPLLHSLPERVTIRRDTYESYRRINRRFAEALRPFLRPSDLVWVQDFHLFHVGRELRRLNWKGKTGFFLHVPFPPADIFAVLPWARNILEGLMDYDLVGFQTERDVYNAVDALRTDVGGVFEDREFVHNGMSLRVGAYPVGIEPSTFRPKAVEEESNSTPRRRAQTPADQLSILGVDRLDYTKGIPQRLRAIERLLERNPSLRGKVNFIQICAPSRTRVPEYMREKERVEGLVGQINGRFSGASWMPIRYLYRSYPPEALAQFYKEADVCLVTPLRDGMNLVAKEFVASQRDEPGVLVLSRFCGAAESMRGALIVNPHDIDGTAAAIYRALRMPKQERSQRMSALMDNVTTHTAGSWCEAFQGDLVDV